MDARAQVSNNLPLLRRLVIHFHLHPMLTPPNHQPTCMSSRLPPFTFRALSYQSANKRESWSRIPPSSKTPSHVTPMLPIVQVGSNKIVSKSYCIINSPSSTSGQSISSLGIPTCLIQRTAEWIEMTKGCSFIDVDTLLG